MTFYYVSNAQAKWHEVAPQNVIDSFSIGSFSIGSFPIDSFSYRLLFYRLLLYRLLSDGLGMLLKVLQLYLHTFSILAKDNTFRFFDP